jgi:hypothetical protein
MSVLLMTRRAGGAAAAGGIASQALRWDAGTGSTVAEIIVPLQQGQLMPANLANVSVWVNGTERGVFLTTRGLWPDNSARVLYGKCTLTLTNGSPLTADVRLTGGFTEPRVSDTDMSARWVTNSGGPNDWYEEGFPAGVIVPTSASHLCAASWLGPLVPEGTEPTFTGSAAVNTAFVDTIDTTPKLWNGSGVWGGAQYDRGASFVRKWMRTGNAYYLQLAMSTLARINGNYWQANGASLSEPYLELEGYSILYLLRNDDTPWTTWIRPKAEGDGGSGDFDANDPAATPTYSNPGIKHPREVSGYLKRLWFGIVCGYGDRVVSGETWKQNADLWLGRMGVSTFFDTGRTWVLNEFESDGTTPKKVVFVYQAGIMAHCILRLSEVLPASANVTAALGLIDSTCDWLWTTSGLRYTSPLAFDYSSGRLYYSNGSETSTVGTGGYGYPQIDLNGFLAQMFASKGLRNNNATDIQRAKDIYATIGFTPRNGGSGPYLEGQKQWDEAFWCSQTVPAYIAQYEAL